MFSLVFTNSKVGLPFFFLVSTSLNEFNWPLMLGSPNQRLSTMSKKREGLEWYKGDSQTGNQSRAASLNTRHIE